MLWFYYFLLRLVLLVAFACDLGLVVFNLDKVMVTVGVYTVLSVWLFDYLCF